METSLAVGALSMESGREKGRRLVKSPAEQNRKDDFYVMEGYV